MTCFNKRKTHFKISTTIIKTSLPSFDISMLEYIFDWLFINREASNQIDCLLTQETTAMFVRGLWILINIETPSSEDKSWNSATMVAWLALLLYNYCLHMRQRCS